MKNTLLVILGPTGVGKTELCLRIAEHFRIPIINADSRQLFRELPIGTAAPTPEQQQRVKHYFVGNLSLGDYYSASRYEEDVMDFLSGYFSSDRKLALMTGGSMMYIDSVCNGIDDIPTIDDKTRQWMKDRYTTEGLEPLCAELEKLDQRKERILREANEEARKILADTKEYADQTMKMFHKFQKDHVDTAAVEKERQNLRTRMNKAEKGMSINTTVKKPKKELKPKDLSLGDTVQVLSMNLKGTVSSHPDSKGFLFVQMGIIRSKVHISDLELVDEPVINTPGLSRTGAGKIRMSKSTSVSTEINLLGKTVDEAVAELDKYLDDAYLAHLKSVRVVHGWR